MLLSLLFFYFLGGSTAENATTPAGTGASSFSKSIMCFIKGNMMDSSSDLVNLEPKDIPCECEVIIYSRFTINRMSVINVDETFLKSVTSLNKPVIVALAREGFYNEWGTVLTSEGNAQETKKLCDWAMKNNIKGFLVESLTPQCMFRPFDPKVANFIVPYIKQLKCTPDFIIGVGVDAHGSSIKNPCMYNFPALNDIVTFYEIRTYALNQCKPALYNGMTPITKVEHGSKYMFGMEEVQLFLKDSKICLTKLTYDIEIYPVDKESTTYSSYSQVCKGKIDCSKWCVQTTKNLYNKGKFALDQGSGIIVKLLDLDDIKNDCGCGSTFIGFKNIIAGFRGGSQVSCAKFDIQSTEFSIQ